MQSAHKRQMEKEVEKSRRSQAGDSLLTKERMLRSQVRGYLEDIQVYPSYLNPKDICCLPRLSHGRASSQLEHVVAGKQASQGDGPPGIVE